MGVVDDMTTEENNGGVKVDIVAEQDEPEPAVAEEDAGASTAPAAPTSPVLVFLNSASGGKMGPEVLEKIREQIPKSQLFDLQEVGEGKWKPEDKLKLFQHVKDTKVLICGGDGTMGWILSCIDRLTAEAPSPLDSNPSSPRGNNFPVAMMPLGTGNDLARSFGWGPGFSRGMLKPKFLDKVLQAPAARLDRWLLSVMPYEPLGTDDKVRLTKIPPTFSLHRYASPIGDPVGLDLGLTAETPDHGRTQKVVRMGRSFSVRMSSQAKLVHEDEMNRSSSQGSRSLTGSWHGHGDGISNFRPSLGGGRSSAGDFKTEETMAESEASPGSGVGVAGGAAGGAPSVIRASSAPPALRYGGGGSHVRPGGSSGKSVGLIAMPTLGEGVDMAEKEEVSSGSSSCPSPSRSPVQDASKKAGGTAAPAAAAAAGAAAAERPQDERGPGAAAVERSGVAGSVASTKTVPPSMQQYPPSFPGQEGKKEETGSESEANGVVLVAALESAATAVAAAKVGRGEEQGAGDRTDLGAKREVSVQTENDKAPRRMGPPPRAMPSISVIQKFETWESYDAVFCNYFSFGVDAIAAAAFHDHRQAHPQLFTSRFRNQVWYARKGFPAAGGIPCGSRPPPPPVSKYLELRVKHTPGGDWETVQLDDTLRGIVVLNLQSYGGGRNLWGGAEAGCSQIPYAKAAPDDGLLEIVGITNIFKLGCIMGFNKAGARAHRVAQAAEVELRVRSEIHMQIDGEPWKQAPAKINIQHYGQSTCLCGGG